MIIKLSLLLGALLLTTSSVWADNQGSPGSSGSGDLFPPQPLVPQEGQGSNPDAPSLTPTEDMMPHEAANYTKAFAGVFMGSSALATVPASESKKDGYQFDVTGVLSFFRPKWNYDLGLGYFSNNMSTSVHNLRVVTNGAMVVFDPQYRVTPQWQLGLAFNLLIGSDVSFSESEAGADSKAFNLLAGVSTKYEIPVGETYSIRLIAQALATITQTDRLIWIAQGGVQFGFPVFGGSQK